MRILVTGVTGLLGNNVARLAVERGHEVVGISRSKPDHPSFSNLHAELIQADLSEPETFQKALHGNIDAIIHCAAFVHIGWTRLDEAMRVNRDGTRQLLKMIRGRGIRFVHISTDNTLAIPARGEIANEETPGDGQVPCSYVVSKRAAEAEVNHAIRDGQHAVIIHPSFMLGPNDWKPSSGKMICELAKRYAPMAPRGGCSVCDMRLE